MRRRITLAVAVLVVTAVPTTAPDAPITNRTHTSNRRHQLA